MSPPAPTLQRLAADREYARIPEHIQRHPQDAAWCDHYGSTVLHTLCLSQSIDQVMLNAVDCILREAPHLVRQPNHASWTPLHLACEKRLLWRIANMTTNATSVSTIEEQLILKLLQACPEAVSVPLTSGFKAKTPFHIACENNASPAVLRAMLRIDPTLAMTSSVKKQDPFTISDTPLQELWSVLRKNNDSEATRSELQYNDSRRKMKVLLKAAYAGNVDAEDSTFHVLCAACSLRCPRDYITQLIEDHPNLIRQPDTKGLLPLHYAVQSAQPEAHYFTDFLLDQLLTEYPEAARIPIVQGNDDRLLPLHVLITDRGCTRPGGGIQRLIKAFPDSLRIPDPRSGLVPVLASAEAAIQSRVHLTTTYELLRAAPDVIQQSS